MRKDIVLKGEKGGVWMCYLQVCGGNVGFVWVKFMYVIFVRDLWMVFRGNIEFQYLLENEGFEEDGGRLYV